MSLPSCMCPPGGPHYSHVSCPAGQPCHQDTGPGREGSHGLQVWSAKEAPLPHSESPTHHLCSPPWAWGHQEQNLKHPRLPSPGATSLWESSRLCSTSISLSPRVLPTSNPELHLSSPISSSLPRSTTWRSNCN